MADRTSPAATAPNPYDELPYRSRPIEWTAPERLALCSLLHGGPRAKLAEYRMLELGCGDGANLLPLAFYRQDAQFVGVDSSEAAITLARARCQALGITNLRFVHGDFAQARRELHGSFDYIVAHGVFSWVPEQARDQLLSLASSLLSPTGLLYLNYNSKPGWNVRGMVRDFLRARTAHLEGLAAQAQAAQEMSAQVAASLESLDHPYAKLMEREYRFVCEGHPSYIAHEFLATENHAYWRSEFMDLASRFGLEHVGDADFNRPSGRIPEALPAQIAAAGLAGPSLDDTVDLLCYRQMHSPILSLRGSERSPVSTREFGRLFVASSLRPAMVQGAAPWTFVHASGHEVEVNQAAMRDALAKLFGMWPHAARIETLFSSVEPWVDDLRLLDACAMIDLRITEPDQHGTHPRLREAEQSWGGYATTPLHREGT